MTSSQPALAGTTVVTLGQARDEFRRSPAASKLSAEDDARLRKFVTWCGVSSAIETIQPFKIQQFLEQQLNTSSPPRSYVPVLRAFFAFAHERGLISTNPMAEVHAPRGSGSTRRTASPAPRATAARGTDVVYVSRGQYESMRAELERLRTEERHRISRLLHDAIKDGDLSENAAYDDAKMRQGLLEARIRELEQKLRNVELIEEQDRSGAGVTVGSRVRLQELASGDEIEYQVVGPEETDPRAGKISHRSPVGTAIMGKSAGDEVEVAAPGGTVRYRIVAVD
jgi:transcription elongation factor GreA